MASAKSPVQSEYQRALLAARNRNLALNQDAQKRLLDGFRESLRRIPIDEGLSITSEMARRMERQIQALLNDFTKLTEELTLKGVDLTIEQVRVQHDRTLKRLSEKYKTRIAYNFEGLNEQVYYNLAQRRGAPTMRSLLKRRYDGDTMGQIGTFIDSAVSRGVAANRATVDLARLMAGDDPALLAAVNKVPANSKVHAFGGYTNLDYERYGIKPYQVSAVKQVYYDARRIAVSEINNTLREATAEAMVQSPVVAAAKWTLSGRHGNEDECDVLALQNLYGHGPGFYPPEFWPPAPHPHCGCYSAGVKQRSPKEWGTPRPTPTPAAAPVDAGSLQRVAAAGGWTDARISRAKATVAGAVRGAEIAFEDRSLKFRPAPLPKVAASKSTVPRGQRTQTAPLAPPIPTPSPAKEKPKLDAAGAADITTAPTSIVNHAVAVEAKLIKSHNMAMSDIISDRQGVVVGVQTSLDTLVKRAMNPQAFDHLESLNALKELYASNASTRQMILDRFGSKKVKLWRNEFVDIEGHAVKGGKPTTYWGDKNFAESFGDPSQRKLVSKNFYLEQILHIGPASSGGGGLEFLVSNDWKKLKPVLGLPVKPKKLKISPVPVTPDVPFEKPPVPQALAFEEKIKKFEELGPAMEKATVEATSRLRNEKMNLTTEFGRKNNDVLFEQNRERARLGITPSWAPVPPNDNIRKLIAERNAIQARMTEIQDLITKEVVTRQTAILELLGAEQRGKVPVRFAKKPQKDWKKHVERGLAAFEQLVDARLLPSVPIHVQKWNYRASYNSQGSKIKVNHEYQTMAHELGHWVEHNRPDILKKLVEFRDSRSIGDAKVRLNKLYPGARYRDNEMTRTDRWVANGGDAYVGKLYQHIRPKYLDAPGAPFGSGPMVTVDVDWASEVLSMGIERLIQSPVQFMQQDREYFEFIVKLIGGY